MVHSNTHKMYCSFFHAHVLVDAHAHAKTDNLEMRDFRRAFGKLDPRDQQIMILIGMEGMSYEETAEVLEVKVGTVSPVTSATSQP